MIKEARKQLLPEDYLDEYSPMNKADLILQISGNGQGLVKNIFFNVLKKIFYIDFQLIIDFLKIKKYLKMINSKNGNRFERVILFLREFYSNDHLRYQEYPFLAVCLNRNDINKKSIVDLGGAHSISTFIPILLDIKYEKIISIDVLNTNNSSKFNIIYKKGNFIDTGLLSNSVDLVTIISTLEHVGLGRYGDFPDKDGDIKTMEEIKRILKVGGHCVLTIPYGYPTVIYNSNRIYDDGRLEKLLHGFQIIYKEYSYEGELVDKSAVKDIKPKNIFNKFYNNIDFDKRTFDSPAGIMLLLKKTN